MALFGSKHDAKLIGSITRELFHKYFSIEVELYKLALGETEINLYNESNKKIYYSPIRLFTNITKDESSFSDTGTAIDLSQTVRFAFLRQDLIDIGTMVSEGDIIRFDSRFYEVDNAFNTQYFMGRNDETFLMSTEGRDRQFGQNISVVAQCHLTRESNLNLVETRVGIDNTVKSKPIYL